MQVERSIINGCCGKKLIVFKVDCPINSQLLDSLKANGFTEAPNFLKAGMIYADNSNLVVSAPIGSNKLNVKCKKNNCDNFLNDFEQLLKTIDLNS